MAESWVVRQDKKLNLYLKLNMYLKIKPWTQSLYPLTPALAARNDGGVGQDNGRAVTQRRGVAWHEDPGPLFVPWIQKISKAYV